MISAENKYTIVSHPDQIDRQQWETFVAGHPQGTIFQTPDYADVHANAPGFTPFVLAIMDDNTLVGILVAIISRVYKQPPLSYFTSRAIVSGGPLVKDNDPALAALLIEKYATEMSHRVIYSQFRNSFDMSSFKEAFAKVHAKYEEHLNILVDLTKTEATLWSEVRPQRRNKIRKAQKNGLTVRELEDSDSIEQSYPILKEVYQHAKLPLFEPSLFTNAFKRLHPKKMLKIYGVFLNEQLIGTMYTLCFNGRIYDWYAGSYRKHYTSNPNDILPWEIFLQSQAEGFTLFDFGGAGKPNVPYGVRDYKILFGGTVVNYGRYEMTHNSAIFALMRVAFRLWQKIS